MQLASIFIHRRPGSAEFSPRVVLPSFQSSVFARVRHSFGISLRRSAWDPLPHGAPRHDAEHTPSIDMDRVLACFATTAEDVAAMVCGSFSHMVPQASERWQRPAVKALVRTVHQLSLIHI